jgi:hypothetical protein
VPIFRIIYTTGSSFPTPKFDSYERVWILHVSNCRDFSKMCMREFLQGNVFHLIPSLLTTSSEVKPWTIRVHLTVSEVSDSFHAGSSGTCHVFIGHRHVRSLEPRMSRTGNRFLRCFYGTSPFSHSCGASKRSPDLEWKFNLSIDVCKHIRVETVYLFLTSVSSRPAARLQLTRICFPSTRKGVYI